MSRGRLEAFSDGVIAVVITIMVLSLRAVPWMSIGLYIAVAVAWFVPDRRVERVLTSASRGSH
jgi:hypothetical protein